MGGGTGDLTSDPKHAQAAADHAVGRPLLAHRTQAGCQLSDPRVGDAVEGKVERHEARVDEQHVPHGLAASIPYLVVLQLEGTKGVVAFKCVTQRLCPLASYRTVTENEGVEELSGKVLRVECSCQQRRSRVSDGVSGQIKFLERLALLRQEYKYALNTIRLQPATL